MKLLLPLLALPLSALARPNPAADESGTDCGNVRDFYDPTPEKWVAANTDEWLNNWWTTNQDSVATLGFSEAFTRATLELSGLTCKLSGQNQNCPSDKSTCSNPMLSSLSPEDMEPAYYVLTALNRFHGYLKGYQETIESAAVVQSFQQDYFTNLFYLDPNAFDSTSLKELINILVTILSIAAGGIGVAVGAGVTAGLIGAGVTMAGAGQTEAYQKIQSKAPDLFGATANSGHALADALKVIFTSIFSLNDKLMNGEEIKEEGEGGQNWGDLRQFLKGGRWVNAPEMNKVNGLDIVTGILESIQINALWRQQPVFIMGGGPCDDTSLGDTPKDQEGTTGWCDHDNKAWYLYFFQSDGTNGAWLARPWGSDRLGKECLLEYQKTDVTSEFPNVEVGDAIRSSVTSWKVNGNNYDSSKFSSRMGDIMRDGNDPLTEQSSLEGLWTIPVCDVSGVIGNSDFIFKKEVLKPYGYKSRPQWCGNICGNSKETTDEFFKKVHLDDESHFAYRGMCGYTNWPGRDD